MTFLTIVFGTSISPRRSLERLAGDRGRVRRGTLAVLFMGTLYALTSLGLGASGAVPLWPVLEGLATDNYYFWQMVLILPGAALLWVIAAGLMHGLTPRKRTDGGFRTALAVTGAAMSGPLFAAWCPQAVQAAFMVLGMRQEEWVAILSDPGPWQALYITCYALAALLALRLFVAASRALRKTARGPAFVPGALAAALVIGVFLALVR
jgi:hypothetical protein